MTCNDCKCETHLSDAACDCPCHWEWEKHDEEPIPELDDVAEDIWHEFHHGKD